MSDYWADVVDQSQAVEQLKAAVPRPVHAYMFVGPAGVGKQQAAMAFAAALLDDERPLINAHPDVITVEREGASVNVAQAREISRIAARSPLEGNRKILILTEFHLVSDAAPALLKTIEEASETTIFLILTETVTHDLVTIASRCVRIDFHLIPENLILQTLLSEGVSDERAREAAVAAMGSIERARLLVSDDGVHARRALWAMAPGRLDGHGAAAAEVVAEIMSSIDLASTPLLARQSEEVRAVEAQVKDGTKPASTMKVLETRHKREQRRLRTDELRAGLAILAQEMPRRLQTVTDKSSVAEVEQAMAALQWASESLQYNPNEALLLQALFVRLSQVRIASLV